MSNCRTGPDQIHHGEYNIQGVGEREKTTWTTDAITALFGSEDSNAARRGALCFWDVIPRIAGDKLMVEVMTGHQSHYYMNGQLPHESGQPIPVYFLTVPPGSGFTFHVVCDLPFLRRAAPELAASDRWRSLLRQAFEHAFAWLGFGAKTSVGYGAMAAAGTGASRGEEAPSPAFQSEETVWENAALLLNPGKGEIVASRNGEKTAPLKGKEADALKAELTEDQRTRLKRKKALKGVTVRVRKRGNLIELTGVVS